MQARKRHKSSREPTFAPIPDFRCPDCEIEGRLNLVGVGRLHRGAWLPYKCDTCKGKGRIPLIAKVRAGCKTSDPYEIPIHSVLFRDASYAASKI